MILDAVILLDVTPLNHHGNDVPQLLQSMKDMLADHHNSLVHPWEIGVNKFEANDHLLMLSFPHCLCS